MSSRQNLARTAIKAAKPSHGTRNASSRAAFLAQQAERVATVSYHSRAARKQGQLKRSVFAIVAAGGLATASQFYINNGQLVRQAHAEAPQEEGNPLVFEKSRKKKNVSVEENRDMISSQHHQVKQSWENPGVYAWGSNSGNVVAPDSDEKYIKTPRRIAYFNAMLLRDIKLDRTFGAAIDEKGDLIQWGSGFMANLKTPVRTLAGKDLVSLSITKDRILGLSKSGKVYSIPSSAEEQETGSKPSESSWIPFWNGRSNISYRDLTPKDLSRGEKVSSISAGLEHALFLTSKGRVFSAAAATDSFPSRGQLGIPGLTWSTRPEGAFDQPHEITTLRGFDIVKLASGDHHSLALDKDGRVFAWGDNMSGQLGFDASAEAMVVDAPSLLPTQKLYAGTSQQPKITDIAAGGENSYMTVEATRVASRKDDPDDPRVKLQVGRVTADTFAFGSGIRGNLANNRWTHVQSTPSKIPTLSGLFEYDEKTNSTVPIRLQSLSVGSTHAAAVMKNITYTDASSKTTNDDTNWGADIVFWGGNEHYQLGTGKRNNVSAPTYLQPLDMEAEVKRAKKSSGAKEEHRFHITPRAYVKLGDGRWKSVEQRVECGRGCTAVYSGT
ncbi:putative regulator of chromosome condensation 1/beta-lactamase-inhibitor protein II [Septoria linicola]|nr:putative regulator of chromosome condensation 1/beta-lactamase-inhibitor protein II [Septoria linicola]